MTKFTSRSDKGYDSILGELIRWNQQQNDTISRPVIPDKTQNEVGKWSVSTPFRSYFY